MKKLLFLLLLVSTLASAQNNFKWIGQQTYIATGTNTYSATIAGLIPRVGDEVKILFSNGNTGSSTFNGATMRKNGSSALSSGDILPGATYRLTFDGTYWQVLGIGGGGGVSLSADNTWTGNNAFRNETRTETGTTYTIQSTDEGLTIEFTNSSDITVTLPNGLAQYFNCMLMKKGTGDVIITATGTLESAGTPTITTQHTGAYVEHKGSNVWEAIGSFGSGGSSYTFTNGQTESGGTVKLGGTLIENTTIDGNYDLELGNYGSNLGSFKAISSGDVNIWSYSGSIYINNAGGGSSMYLNGAYVSFLGSNVFLPNPIGMPIGTSSGDGGRISLRELAANGTNTVGFKAPNSIASDLLWTLPAADGSGGQVLSTNGSGVLSWANSSSGLTIGSTAITGGTSGRLLTSGSTVGELTLGSGVSTLLGTFNSNNLSTTVSDPVRTVTGTDAIVQADNGRTIYFNSGTDFNFTIDQLTINSQAVMINIGVGIVTFVNGTGVTIQGATTLAGASGGNFPTAIITYQSATSPIIMSSVSDYLFQVTENGPRQTTGLTGSGVYRGEHWYDPITGLSTGGNYDHNIFQSDGVTNSVVAATCVITGVNSDGSKIFSKEMKATFRKPGTSDMVQVGSTTDIFSHNEGLTGPSATLSVNADRLRVTWSSGSGGESLQWTHKVTLFYSTY